ncbi:MAG: PHP domain-containing protein [Candidatus Aenigmatarchaeota archaeon]
MINIEKIHDDGKTLCELHCHTNFSHGKKIFHDGLDDPKDMVRHASSIGLNAVAITDHDTIEGALKAKRVEKKYGIEVIIGEEVSCKDGHILAYGIQELVRPGLGIDETLDNIHEQGGIAIASHPFDIRGCGLKELAGKCDAIEIFNAISIDRITNFKCRAFAEKKRMPFIAGSDAHHKSMMGYGMTVVNSNDNVLKAIKKGRVEIFTKYTPVNIFVFYAVNRLKLSYDETIAYMEKNYIRPKLFLGKKLLTLVEKSPGRIDKLFNFFAYIGLGAVVTYEISRELANRVF